MILRGYTNEALHSHCTVLYCCSCASFLPKKQRTCRTRIRSSCRFRFSGVFVPIGACCMPGHVSRLEAAGHSPCRCVQPSLRVRLSKRAVPRLSLPLKQMVGNPPVIMIAKERKFRVDQQLKNALRRELLEYVQTRYSYNTPDEYHAVNMFPVHIVSCVLCPVSYVLLVRYKIVGRSGHNAF